MDYFNLFWVIAFGVFAVFFWSIREEDRNPKVPGRYPPYDDGWRPPNWRKKNDI